jgi:hypothetical protein
MARAAGDAYVRGRVVLVVAFCGLAAAAASAVLKNWMVRYVRS